jgi:hypothetical protein
MDINKLLPNNPFPSSSTIYVSAPLRDYREFSPLTPDPNLIWSRGMCMVALYPKIICTHPFSVPGFADGLLSYRAGSTPIYKFQNGQGVFSKTDFKLDMLNLSPQDQKFFSNMRLRLKNENKKRLIPFKTYQKKINRYFHRTGNANMSWLTHHIVARIERIFPSDAAIVDANRQIDPTAQSRSAAYYYGGVPSSSFNDEDDSY